jgi:acetyl-CoA synthetase
MPLKPGSATRPYFGVDAEIVDADGKTVPDGEEGFLVLKQTMACNDTNDLRR